jgi:hypothetical protein
VTRAASTFPVAVNDAQHAAITFGLAFAAVRHASTALSAQAQTGSS